MYQEYIRTNDNPNVFFFGKGKQKDPNPTLHQHMRLS